MARRPPLLALAAALWLCAAPPRAAHARPWPCLPPLFDSGLRLHPLPTPRLFWLQILLRQHDLCRSPADEVRASVFGNSAVYGLPLGAEDTFVSHLNEGLRQSAVPASLYNLAFVTSYQVKDALILHAALEYQPDVIVWAITRSDFVHRAPNPYPTLVALFGRNRDLMEEMTAAPPRGLEEPVLRYATARGRQPGLPWAVLRLREVGTALRSAARANAAWLRERLHSPPPPPPESLMRGQRSSYDCAETRRNAARDSDWQSWNVLAELERLRDTRGIEVVVVHWPIAHEPIEDCYSFRYTNQAVDEFAQWLAADTRRRGLPFADLHQLLPPELFVDSIHVTAEGHRRIAAALAPVLDPILRAAAERKGLPSGAPR